MYFFMWFLMLLRFDQQLSELSFVLMGLLCSRANWGLLAFSKLKFTISAFSCATLNLLEDGTLELFHCNYYLEISQRNPSILRIILAAKYMKSALQFLNLMSKYAFPLLDLVSFLYNLISGKKRSIEKGLVFLVLFLTSPLFYSSWVSFTCSSWFCGRRGTNQITSMFHMFFFKVWTKMLLPLLPGGRAWSQWVAEESGCVFAAGYVHIQHWKAHKSSFPWASLQCLSYATIPFK